MQVTSLNHCKVKTKPNYKVTKFKQDIKENKNKIYNQCGVQHP